MQKNRLILIILLIFPINYYFVIFINSNVEAKYYKYKSKKYLKKVLEEKIAYKKKSNRKLLTELRSLKNKKKINIEKIKKIKQKIEKYSEKIKKIKHFLRIKELSRTKKDYRSIILKDKSFPHKELLKNNLEGIAGPKDSNLYAVVRIKNSGKKSYYRRDANKILYNNKNLQKSIRKRFLSDGDEFYVEKDKHGNYLNPYIIKSDGSKISFDWHHNPNWIQTVDLIPYAVHKKEGVFELIHIDGKKGGNKMYNTKYSNEN